MTIYIEVYNAPDDVTEEWKTKLKKYVHSILKEDTDDFVNIGEDNKEIQDIFETTEGIEAKYLNINKETFEKYEDDSDSETDFEEEEYVVIELKKNEDEKTVFDNYYVKMYMLDDIESINDIIPDDYVNVVDRTLFRIITVFYFGIVAVGTGLFTYNIMKNSICDC